MAVTSSPARVRRSASSSALIVISTYSFNHDSGTRMSLCLLLSHAGWVSDPPPRRDRYCRGRSQTCPLDVLLVFLRHRHCPHDSAVGDQLAHLRAVFGSAF